MAHVSLITLGSADLQRTSTFYESIGWRRSEASVEGTVTFLRGGALVLGVYGSADLAAEAGVEDDGRGWAGMALAMNVGSREEVDGALAAAQQAGGTVTRPAQATDWGGYSGYFRDPDGHLWEVAHNPGFGLLPDGQVVLPDERA